MRISDWSSDVCSSDLQILEVVDEHIGRIMPRLMRRLARPVDAQVGYDDAIAVRGDARRGAELDPVDLGARKQAVEQHDRPALAHLAPRQPHAAARVEKLGSDAHASGLWTFPQGPCKGFSSSLRKTAERRVGTGLVVQCVSRWSRENKKKK